MTEERKEIITIQDMMEMLSCSYSTASRTIRQVKAFSNLLEISGKIHRKDWEAYLNRFNKKDTALGKQCQ